MLGMPGTPGDGMAPNIASLMRDITDLKRQILELKAARVLDAATIDQGGLTVNGGSIQVTNGSITVTGGSIHIANGGTLIVDDAFGNSLPLSQLAFGLTAWSNTAATTPAINTWSIDATTPSFNVVTGRAIVLVTCRMVVGSSGGGTPCQGSMSYQLNGPTSAAADRTRGVHFEFNGSGMNTTGQASFAYVHTGLTNGTYSLNAAYMADSTGSPSNSTTFSNRSLIVLPF